MAHILVTPPVDPTRSPSPNSLAAHLATSEYSLRMPDMPRVDMPQVYRRGSTQGPLFVGPPIYNPDPSRNVDFLGDSAYAIEPLEVSKWDYDFRRQAQSILPFLYVAPMSTCRDASFLEGHGITMLVGIHPREGANIYTAGVNKVARERGIEHHVVTYEDSALLIQSFSNASFLISSHLSRLQERGRVTVYCHSGNEKAPTFIAAYLMETFQGPLSAEISMSAERAMSVVLTRRFCVHFDEESRRMLKAHEDIVRARAQVLGSSSQTSGQVMQRHQVVQNDSHVKPTSASLCLKRLRDGMLHNVADDYWEDRQRFEGREHAPFRD
jgi:serine/threonine/tyrosine-interacting protein